MAILRPIKKNQTTTEMYASQVHIKEGEEDEVAKKMFEEDKDILYFFSDDKTFNHYTEELNMKIYNMFLDDENINDISLNNYDYIIDACDTVIVKKLLIKICKEKNIKLIYSCGPNIVLKKVAQLAKENKIEKILEIVGKLIG